MPIRSAKSCALRYRFGAPLFPNGRGSLCSVTPPLAPSARESDIAEHGICEMPRAKSLRAVSVHFAYAAAVTQNICFSLSAITLTFINNLFLFYMGYWFTFIGSLFAIISALLIFIGFLISPNDNFIKGPNSIKQKFLNNASVYVHNSPGAKISINQNQQKIEEIPPDFRTEGPIRIKLTYKPPKLTEGGQCDDEKCVGNYTKIGEDNDSIYLDHPSFVSSRVTGYNYDSGLNGEKIITNWNVEEKRIYDSIKLPKNLILNTAILSDSESTTKSIPNYKVIK